MFPAAAQADQIFEVKIIIASNQSIKEMCRLFPIPSTQTTIHKTVASTYKLRILMQTDNTILPLQTMKIEFLIQHLPGFRRLSWQP